MEVMDIPKDAADCEAFFRNAVKLTLENKFPWTILALIVDQMSPTVEEAKELVKVLLNELQILQKKHQQLIENKVHPNSFNSYQNNDEVEILEHDSSIEESEIKGFDGDAQKVLGQITDNDIENEIEDVEKRSEIEKES